MEVLPASFGTSLARLLPGTAHTMLRPWAQALLALVFTSQVHLGGSSPLRSPLPTSIIFQNATVTLILIRWMVPRWQRQAGPVCIRATSVSIVQSPGRCSSSTRALGPSPL